MEQLIEFYNRNLGFKDFYHRILLNSSINKSEFIQNDNLLKGINNKITEYSSNIECFKGDVRIDVPVWFGDLSKAKRRIIIFGLEPRDTNKDFNIEKIGNKVFGSPFGIDRWNVTSSVKGKPQNKYYRVFNDLIADEDNFVLFSDIVKDYEIISTNNESKLSDSAARKTFVEKANNQFELLQKEIALITPTHLFTLGVDSFSFLSKHIQDLHYLRHPSQGGESIAKETLYDILKIDKS